jgi:hypothetical protein
MDTEEANAMLRAIIGTYEWYVSEGMAVDYIELPTFLYPLAANVTWPSEIALGESGNALILYYIGDIHIGTQRP